jgi:adenosine deaminase
VGRTLLEARKEEHCEVHMISSHTMPKAELHCHFDGILDPAMLRDIRRSDPAFPIDPEEFERAYPIDDLERFFKWWEAIDPIEGHLAYFFPILSRHIERLKTQHVVYTEIMVAAGELPEDIGAAIDAVVRLRELTNRHEAQRIQVEFLVAFSRNKPLERVERIAERILALHRAGLIVGVALAGPEIGNPVRPFERVFARFHDAGLKIEIHAGEWCGPESV